MTPRCGVFQDFNQTRLQCDRDTGHEDAHGYGSQTWRNRHGSTPQLVEGPLTISAATAASSAIFFPDISNVGNVGLSIQPATVAVTAKASEGTTFTDPSYQRFKSQAAGVGAVFMAYHWLWSSSASEAAHVHGIVGGTPLLIDAENLSVNTTVGMILDFVKNYRALGGVVHAVYLPHWYWQGHLNSPDLRPLAAAGLHLYSSNYTSYSDTGPGWNAYGGVTPSVWQYTDRFHYGTDSTVDFNAFKGSVSQYRTLITGTLPPPPPSPPTPDAVHSSTGESGLDYWYFGGYHAQYGNANDQNHPAMAKDIGTGIFHRVNAMAAWMRQHGYTGP